MRPFIVAANWKMHKGPAEAVSYLKAFLPLAMALPGRNKIIFFVPAIDLWVTQEVLRDSQLGWGAQNCHFEKHGAFTGENSPAVIAEILTPYTLVGHSERRAIFGETDEMMAKKVRALQDVGVEPMLCVGETLSEREAGKTGDVIRHHLREGLKLRDPAKPFLVAYEPVWAIGTGKVAGPAEAEEVHAAIRTWLKGKDDALAERTRILYGGSVKADNAAALLACPNIDGALVGGASLDAASFGAIAKAANGPRPS